MRKLFLLLLLFSHSLFARQISDINGVQVVIPDHPQRIVLGESRMLYTLALLQPGYPAAHIAGWPADLAKYDPAKLASVPGALSAAGRHPTARFGQYPRAERRTGFTAKA